MTYLYLKSKEEKLSFTIPYDRQSFADYLKVDRSVYQWELVNFVKKKLLNARKLFCVEKTSFDLDNN